MDFDDPEFRRRWLRRHQNNARNRARRAGLAFDLCEGTTEHESTAENLYNAQGGWCAVTGVRFSLEAYPKALVKHPFAPSLDQRLPKGGYTKDNVRLVCVAVNFGLGEWGDQVYLSLAQAANEFRKQKEADNEAAEHHPGSEWYQRQQARIDTAEKILSLLPEDQRHGLVKHIAGLRSALKKGPQRLKEAGVAASRTRRRLMRIQERAESVFHSAGRADKWLRSPLPILHGKAPLEIARAEAGARIIEEILAKIEWGGAA